MVASIDGNSLGLGNSSINTLDLQRGDAASGRSGETVYVNAATGNLVVQQLDELLVGLGPDLPVLRTYNSQANTDGDNDDNWRIGFYRRLVDLDGDVNRAGSAITRIDGDGAYARYRYDGGRGLYLNADGAGAYDTLRFDSVTRLWSWTDGDSGVTETYQQDAATGHRQLIRQQDPDGNSTRYTYAANGLLQKVASGGSQFDMLNQVELVYDTRPGQTSNLLEVRSTAWDAASGLNLGITRVRYGYDEKQRLASVSVDLSPEDGSIADGQVYVTRYTYDGGSKRLACISQSDGSHIAITWKQVNGEHRVASLVNAQGELTRYDYDSDKRVTTVTDAMGFETRYTHDAAGRLLQISAPPVDGVAQIRQFAYNDNGDVLRIADAKGQVTERSYDRNGLLLEERDAAGNTVLRSYNAQNQLLSLTRYRVPDSDGRGPLAASEPQTTRYVYDPAQGYRLLFVISAEGRVTEYRYNGLGQRASQIQYTQDFVGAEAAPDALQMQAWTSQRDLRLALRTDTSWDYRGQVESQTYYQRLDPQGQGIADGSQAVTRYVYSANGQLLQTITANGGVTQFVRDGLNREILRSNALGEITRTLWDDAGNRTIVSAPSGLQSTLQYDSAGRLVTTLQSDPEGVLLSRSDYFYDDNGRLRATRDGTGVMRWMLYDAAGRKSAEVDGNGSLSEYRYDANDQLIHTIHYARAVRALWPPVMDVEVFNYSDPGLAADQPPLHTSLAGLGLSDQVHGELLTPVTRFQSSGFNAEDARHFAATDNLKTYALRSSGSFTVFEEGEYSFFSRSDAGSRLYNALANSLVEQMQITQTAQAAVESKPQPQTATEVVEETVQQWLVDESDFGPVALAGDSTDLGPRKVRAGDYRGSLERVARAQLGPNATQREINNYVGQLFEINGISNARTIQPDQMILLPESGTLAATAGLAKYGKDIAYGEQVKAALEASQRLAESASAYPTDPRDGMRVGPTVERALATGLMPTASIASAQPTTSSAGMPAYDKASLVVHGVLGVAGAVPVLGAIPDALDLIYSATEYPFGKSSKTDLALGAVALGASVIPGADQVAAAAKVANRVGDVAGAAKKIGAVDAAVDAGRMVEKIGANTTDRAFKSGEDILHFEKHGSEIAQTLGDKSYSLSQYLQDANSVVRNGTFAPELNAYVSIPGGVGSAKDLLVGLDRTTGEITTMHMKPVSWFETKAPSLGWQAQPKSIRTDTVGPDVQNGWKPPY